jgi:hypothetical protein
MEYWKDGQKITIPKPNIPLFHHSSIPFYWLCGLCALCGSILFLSSELGKRVAKKFPFEVF